LKKKEILIFTGFNLYREKELVREFKLGSVSTT
jgi:hypothetical protein